MRNVEGDLTYLGDELLLTWEDFDQIKQPNLTANDLVIFLEGTIESDTAHLDAIKTRATAARASGSKVACITVHEDGAEGSAGGAAGTFAGVAWDAHVAVVLPAVRLEALVVKGLPQGEGCLLAELAMKLVYGGSKAWLSQALTLALAVALFTEYFANCLHQYFRAS